MCVSIDQIGTIHAGRIQRAGEAGSVEPSESDNVPEKRAQSSQANRPRRAQAQVLA
jgi:hypothetical protein